MFQQAKNKSNNNTTEKQSEENKKYASQSIANEFKAKIENYKNITHFITADTNFNELFKENFELDSNDLPGICLSGLHTCGNLAASCITIYNRNKDISALCNIGCCYHLLTEYFNKFTYVALRDKSSQVNPVPNIRDLYSEMQNEIDPGFPLSKYLYTQQVELGRSARMLACQSIHRVVNRKEQPHNHLFFRALVDILIKEKCPEYYESVEVGKIKRCSTFIEYVRKCSKKSEYLKAFDNISENELNALWEKYSKDKPYLDLFYLIRLSLAQVIETVILLDRLLYLKEFDEEIANSTDHNDRFNDSTKRKSYLVKVFDPVVSPRCYGIVGIK